MPNNIPKAKSFMKMGAHSKLNTDGVFAKRDMDLIKAAPAFNKGTLSDAQKLAKKFGDSGKQYQSEQNFKEGGKYNQTQEQKDKTAASRLANKNKKKDLIKINPAGID